MSKPCCPDLRCADPGNELPRSSREQVQMVLEVGLVAALLDGQMPDDKQQALVTAMRLLPGLRDIAEEDVIRLLARAGENTQRGDPWLCEVYSGLKNPALRRVAFRLAALFCAYDGVIDDKEQGYLNWLSHAFEFGDEETAQLFAEATGQTGTVEPVAAPS